MSNSVCGKNKKNISKCLLLKTSPRVLSIKVNSVNVLKFHTPKCLSKWHMQTVQTQIRLKEQSDEGLHCLPLHSVIKEMAR